MEHDHPELRRMRTARRRSMREQGYGPGHRARRRMLAPFVAAGLATCARCGKQIKPGEAWDLGHHDYDRSLPTAPEHAACNRGAPNRLRTSRAW